ncbi:MAG: zinc-ribbon domain-containing protein [Acidobacteria bacterium]|nr:zinc-ribbon domain-containing protein [Acidobacteriota bacterium]
MIVQCVKCQTKYKFDEAKFAGRPTKKIKCPKCEHIFEVANPDSVEEIMQAAEPDRQWHDEARPEHPRRREDETTSQKDGMDGLFGQMNEGVLELPPDKKLSLAIIKGNNQGKIFPLDRPRMTIGRSSADIVVNDMEVSRQHAAIEVFSDKCIVRDLNSTNGTFVDGVKIKLHPMENHSEFRIGNTTLMLIMTGIGDEDLL